MIVTGHSEQGKIHEAVRLGIHGFLVKPVSHTNLENQIVRALKRSAIDPTKLAPKKRGIGVGEVEVLDFNKKNDAPGTMLLKIPPLGQNRGQHRGVWITQMAQVIA